MKKFILSSVVAAIVAVCTAFTFYGDEILAKLGIDKSYADQTVFANVAGEGFQLPYAKLLPSIVQGDKVGAAKELCIYIKDYCKSEDFKKAYAQKREDAKPTSEPPRADAETIKGMKESLKQYDELLKNPAIKSMPKEVVDGYRKAADAIKVMIAESEDQTPNKTKWEKKYPLDPDTLIKRQLRAYLSLVASVDFNAELIPKNGKKIFANPEYERKSDRWKACFRAGKDVNDAIKSFVQQWLKEL
jgi:hypothetical protein